MRGDYYRPSQSLHRPSPQAPKVEPAVANALRRVGINDASRALVICLDPTKETIVSAVAVRRSYEFHRLLADFVVWLREPTSEERQCAAAALKRKGAGGTEIRFDAAKLIHPEED